MDIEQFVKDRNEALLSLDRKKIMAYYRKYGQDAIANDMDRRNDEEFFHPVHKAITAITSFPREVRIKSKQWLDERGYKSMDDGDL